MFFGLTADRLPLNSMTRCLIVLFAMFAGCASIRGSSRESTSKTIPFSNTLLRQTSASSKELRKTSVPTIGSLRFTSISRKAVIPETESASIEIDRIDRSPTDSSLYLDRQSLANLTDLDLLAKPVEKGAVWDRLLNDQTNFYSKESLIGLGIAFGTGAVIANTDIDNQIQKHFQSSVRGATSDEWFHFLHSNKELGNGVYTLPVFGAAWLASEYIDGPPIFETVGLWGERSMRGFLVGAPPLILMQHLTGGSRPYETIEGSEWHPFRDTNGVSGHAFMSSLPFITAAKLSESSWQKTFWYSASAIGPLSRVNDNAHYPSQVGLGWAIALVSATAINQTDTGKKAWSLTPQSSLTSSGVALQYRW